MRIINKIRTLISGGSERSRNVKKNALGAMIIKVFSLLIDFAKVPVLLTYLDPEHYGVYLTITSIVFWTHNFDFGLGTGLRYKLTEAVSLRNFEYGKKLVSTAYYSMSMIMGLLLLLLIPIIAVLDWNSILNSTLDSRYDLAICVLLVLVVFLTQFVLELISIVLQSYQRAAISTLFKPAANLVTLLVILLLRLCSTNSLIYASLAMTVPIVVVLFLTNVFYFSREYKNIAPSYKYFTKSCLKDIYSLGIKYFLSQLSSLVIFNTTSFLLTYLINPEATAVFNTAYTYFGVIVLFNTMAMQPIVAAVTDAYVKNDYSWIKSCFTKIKNISTGLTLASLAMLAVSQFVFRLWIGDKLQIPWDLSIILTFFFVLNIWSTPYINFLSGVGKMNVMVIVSLVKIILYIPFSVYMIKIMGTNGLVWAIIIINMIPNIVVGCLQYYLIINKKATGIWNK